MPLDRGIIDQQLEALGESTRWWEEREFRDLPAVLRADENLLALSRGKVARVRVTHRTWLIVVTDQRLLCLRSMRRAGWRQLEIGAGKILRVALRIGPFRGRVIVSSAGRTCRLLVARADGYRLSSVLSTLCAPAKPVSSRLRPTLMVRRVIDHVLALPAAALGPDAPPPKPKEAGADAEAATERV
ncbi:MAG: PH domain-containing protein, partial [Gemmatimonadota bacterium]